MSVVQPASELPVSSFRDLHLLAPLLQAIADTGYTQPTPIQQRAIPLVLGGGDLLAAAQTGTGKTAGFTLPILQRLMDNAQATRPGRPRCLILTPTRELAAQVQESVQTYGKYLPLKSMVMFGGVGIQPQIDALRRRVDIVVATPGRLLDHAGQKTIDLSAIEVLVLDEADRMLDMGFIPDVKRILYRCPKVERRQTLMFSATFSDDVLNLSRRWTTRAVHIEIESPRQTTDAVEQHVFMVSTDEKLNIICRYIELNQVKRAIIFGNRRDETRRLEAELTRRGISCALLSGEVPQAKRIRTLEQFKQGKIEILVATDVAGRGIHVEGVSHVFNYNLPEDPEDYVHRIGRTGRAGETGVSISFACEDDAFLLPEIEAYIGRKLACEYPHHLLEK